MARQQVKEALPEIPKYQRKVAGTPKFALPKMEAKKLKTQKRAVKRALPK